MTGRREDFPLEKVTLNLYKGEFAKLRRLYTVNKAGKVVRLLVHAHLAKLDRKINERVAPATLEVDLKEILP